MDVVRGTQLPRQCIALDEMEEIDAIDVSPLLVEVVVVFPLCTKAHGSTGGR